MGAGSDWEALMDGAFGRRGRLNAGETDEAKSALAKAQAQLEAMLERQKQAADTAPVSGETLQKNSARLNETLQRQADEIAALGSELTQNMQRDGLLSARQAQEARQQPVPSFEGLGAALNARVLGQEDFVKKLVMAFKRPFVMGAQPPKAQNSLLICGGEGTGRHYALQCMADELAARRLLPSAEIAWVDLALYPGPGQEKLFLQDLYAALHAKGQIVAFDHYEACHPGFLNVLARLVIDGESPLAARYVVQKGILVEAGTALVPNAVASLTPQGKYLVFFSHKGREALADQFGAAFVNALGDVCATVPFTAASLAALAAGRLNEVAARAKGRLGFRLKAGEDVRDLAAAQSTAEGGAEPVLAFCEDIFKALSQYLLENDAAPGLQVELTVRQGELLARFGQEQARPLFGLLGGRYTGALEAVTAELDKIVGLGEIKQYVLGLKDNVEVQRRRRAEGLKTASLSMHMIFTGNPGTGKTTIARLVSQYLKAIGALSGGQLVEVSRADLVGRYVGHTAPLTNQVIASALGGVLFIDEAYSLYRGQDDSFGLEAIDTLVKGMEDHRDELVVILAGYSREMAQFLQANSGLASRFPNTIEFPDYTGEELLAITKLQAGGKGYRMEEACDMPLLAYYRRKQAENAAQNGNGRMARNLLEAAILNQSRRLVADPAAPLDLLLAGDFELDD